MGRPAIPLHVSGKAIVPLGFEPIVSCPPWTPKRTGQARRIARFQRGSYAIPKAAIRATETYDIAFRAKKY